MSATSATSAEEAAAALLTEPDTVDTGMQTMLVGTLIVVLRWIRDRYPAFHLSSGGCGNLARGRATPALSWLLSGSANNLGDPHEVWSYT